MSSFWPSILRCRPSARVRGSDRSDSLSKTQFLPGNRGFWLDGLGEALLSRDAHMSSLCWRCFMRLHSQSSRSVRIAPPLPAVRHPGVGRLPTCVASRISVSPGQKQSSTSRSKEAWLRCAGGVLSSEWIQRRSCLQNLLRIASGAVVFSGTLERSVTG